MGCGASAMPSQPLSSKGSDTRTSSEGKGDLLCTHGDDQASTSTDVEDNSLAESNHCDFSEDAEDNAQIEDNAPFEDNAPIEDNAPFEDSAPIEDNQCSGSVTNEGYAVCASEGCASGIDMRDNAPSDNQCNHSAMSDGCEDETTKFVEDPTRSTINSANSSMEDNGVDGSEPRQHFVPVFPNLWNTAIDYAALRGVEYEQQRATVASALAASAAREDQRRELEHPASAAYLRGVHEEGRDIFEVYDGRRRTVQFAIEVAAAREARMQPELVAKVGTARFFVLANNSTN